MKKIIPGSTSRLKIVDHNETYGRHVLERFVKKIKVNNCLDIGCGFGNDLDIVKKNHSKAVLNGIDYGDWNKENLKNKGINHFSINIENQKFPFDNEKLDLIIANQVIEHTKEIYWINHEIFRTLKVGGYFFMGVPNLLSLHNRILMLSGYHPTSSKMISAHVRVFSKNDVLNFYKYVANEFCKVKKFYGSQFYPFPKLFARPLSIVLPGLAFSSFYIIQKTDSYNNEFLKWPEYANLETNFYTNLN